MTQEHSRAEAVDYVATIIKAKPDTLYADLVKTGKKDGYHVYPLIAGLAKNKLGMGRPKKKRATVRPRGRRPGRPAGAGRRGPGRPPSMNGITGDPVRGISQMQNDVAATRDALRQIAKLSARF